MTPSFLQEMGIHLTNTFVKPYRVTLDASTICQLSCPTCPNTSGAFRKGIGHGFLHFNDFKNFIEKNPWIKNIELSNWGEIFLNPELKQIIQYGYKKKIALSANNGANMNTLSDDIIEALVKYKLRSLTCSLDGASQESYSKYRVKGQFDVVINNIKKINAYKKRYHSPYPALTWQFIAFGHNETEIAKARKISHDLNMKFKFKLSWDDLYNKSFSPIKNKDLIREESGLNVADRTEYEQEYGENYIARTCYQLWTAPQINYDGKLLGCTINYWSDFGNVFDHSLKYCLSGERIQYARKMVLGRAEARDDIPCTQCKLYHGRKEKKSWVKLADLYHYFMKEKIRHILMNKKENPMISALYQFRKKRVHHIQF